VLADATLRAAREGGLTMFEHTPRRPEQGRGDLARSPGHPREDPLALDPYSPIFVTRAPEWNGPEPLALDPYSPIAPRPAGRK